jgi:hypothetical protein
MPRTTKKKRQSENEAKEDEESSEIWIESMDEDDDDENEGDDEDQDMPTMDMASPSKLRKKDMFLRSGKRKRRRSQETSGLTPPEQITARKKSRKSMRRDKNDKPPLVAAVDKGDSVVENMQEQKLPARGRESLLLSDPNALAAAQEPRLSTTSKNSDVDDSDEEGRRLFDKRPPKMSSKAVTRNISPKKKSKRPAPKSRKVIENGVHEEFVAASDEETSYSIYFRFLFLVFFSLSFLHIWSFCVTVADMLIPLKEYNSVVNATEPEKLIPVASIVEGFRKLKIAKEDIGENILEEKEVMRNLESNLKSLSAFISSSQKKIRIRTNSLTKAETLLKEAMEEENLYASVWEQAREAAERLGKTLIETSVLDLWEVDEPIDCSGEAEVEESSDDEDDPLLNLQLVDEEKNNLLLRASITAEKIVKSKDAEASIREWVRDQIDELMLEDKTAVAALKSLRKGSSGMEDLENIIQDRLQLEMADGTAMFDYASRINGASVIYGGKRGTTKSLVDSLPLYNRLMQLSRLRFYGYGPEAAITPTYPKHALGQCWSFQQLTVKEQMKRRKQQKDDHKHGNFGSLTIQLSNPVYISTISIEHPPEIISDHQTSAIRSFRVIGYTDKMANGKAWSLGSFEYEMKEDPLQEFEVATDIFGTPVPKLQSITLAIDSNWGFEYSCLYRFRVHGDDDYDDGE